MLKRLVLSALFWLLTVTLLPAQTPAEWTTNHAPFRIVGNLYYVGSNDLAAYLLTTFQGNILFNANLASSVPQIRQNIEALGFRLADTKILLISQAHFDHVGGLAELQRQNKERKISRSTYAIYENSGLLELGTSELSRIKIERLVQR